MNYMDYVWAFTVGGLICLLGQLLMDLTKLTPARIMVSFVVAGVVLTAIGWYGKLEEFAGGGATVPLTGFGYLLAEGVKRAVTKDGLIGAFSGGLTAAASGLAAVMLFGLVVASFFKRGDRVS